MATSLLDHKTPEPLDRKVPDLLDRKDGDLGPLAELPPELAPALAASDGAERKHLDAATRILQAPPMTEKIHVGLLSAYPVLRPSVEALMARGKSRNEAWLIAGALLGYTGARPIPGPIRKATGMQAKTGEEDPIENPSLVNKALRGEIGVTGPVRALVTLLEGIDALPDVDDTEMDPTRMMNSYPLIDTHYAVGSVLIMAEVGSVSRNAPASGSDLYQRRYRLHFKGGLKDVTLLNPAQQEVIYAPGAMYHVESRRVGKVKVKKGNQAHVHIYLRHVTRASPEYLHAHATGHLWDLRIAAFQH